MKTLLWREWGWNRALVIAGVVIFLIPYTIATGALVWPSESPVDGDDVAYVVIEAAIVSCFASTLTITCLAGNAFAGERTDRTAEFLAYLPISKLRRLIGKLSLSAIVALFIFGSNWLVVWLLEDQLDIQIRIGIDFFTPIKNVAFASLVMFGAAWFVSSFQSSATFAVCAGVAAPMLIMLGLAFVVQGLESSGRNVDFEQVFEAGFPICTLAIFALGFPLGTWLFLRRIEP